MKRFINEKCRFDGDMKEDENGDWVLYADTEKMLQALNLFLTAESPEDIMIATQLAEEILSDE